MPQSLSNLLAHLVFRTKDRSRFIDDSTKPRLHAYLAGVVREMKCECYRVGGTDDHVHLAVRIHRTVSISDLIESLKTGSSKWMKAQQPDLTVFSWQRGYGAFSSGVSELNPILEYVDSQAEHHREWSFQDEYRTLLREQGMPVPVPVVDPKVVIQNARPVESVAK